MEKSKEKSGSGSVTAAAARVNESLEPLEQDDRVRVIEAAAALFGVSMGRARPRGESGGRDEMREPDGGGGGGTAKRVSLVELTNQKKPATNAQRVAVFAYYREKIEGQANFARADLLQYFATAKAPKPGNYDRDFSLAVKEGWIHEEKDQSYLTRTGAEAVEAGFAGKGKPRGVAARKRRAKRVGD